MKTKLEELIQILEKEASLYEELRRLSQEEEEVVIEGNLKKLDNIVRQQEGLLWIATSESSEDNNWPAE